MPVFISMLRKPRTLALKVVAAAAYTAGLMLPALVHHAEAMPVAAGHHAVAQQAGPAVVVRRNGCKHFCGRHTNHGVTKPGRTVTKSTVTKRVRR